MPRKKEIEDDAIEVPGIEYEDISDIEQALSGLPDDGSQIYLFRMYDRGRPKFLTKMEPSEFDLEIIREQFGGGRFKYTAKKNGAVIREGQFEIEGEPKTPKFDDGTNGHTTFDKYDVVAMLKDEISALKQELTQKKKESEQTLATMLGAILQNSQNRESADDVESKILSKLAMYKSLFTGTEVSTDTIFNAMTKGMEIAAAAGGEGTPIWLTVAEKLKEPLTQIATAYAQSKVGEMPKPKKQIEESKMTKNPVIDMIKPYLSLVVTAASKNADPALYADLVIDNLPADKKDEVISWLSSEQCLKDLVACDNRISLQLSWWNELRQQIIEGLQDDSIRESATDSETEST